MAEKETLLTEYRKQIHNIAMASHPLDAEAARKAAVTMINNLEGKVSDRDILDMRETVSVFYWKAAKRMAEGL